MVPCPRWQSRKSWADNNVPVENNFDTTVRTTAGDDPINSDDGGIVKSIVPYHRLQVYRLARYG